MPIELTDDFVRKAIYTKHPNTETCIKFAKKLDVHAKGFLPDRLITDRRPSESEKTQEYRKKIYVPITKEAISKVIKSLAKIRRSQDWNIQYDASVVPKSIKEDETLESYCENNYPDFTSLTNWAFSELLQRSLIDANSVCAVIPKELPANNSEYLKPQVEIFGSDQIMNYVPGEFYCLQSADTVIEKGKNNQNYSRKIYYIITDTQIAKYEERTNGGLELTMLYNHNFGELPVFKVGGVYYDRLNNDTIMESHIAPMVPFLDEAAREYSDLQAEIVQHVHSEKYIYTNTECPTCKGIGVSKDENGKPKECHHCKGRGKINSVSPYGEYLINPSRLDENSVPTPPIGYIQKNTDIPRLQNERINEHTYKALSAVNMEFLAQTPLNQSGVAKEVDQDELNNFVNAVAEDIVMVLDNVYYFICQYRYAFIIPNKAERDKMLPVIPVPERFGLLNSSVLMQEIQTAKASNINPVLLKYMEIEYARKKYNADPEVANELELIFDLDPLYGYNQQDKMTMLSNGGITELDYIISCNIAQFVQRAFKDFDDFEKKSFNDKKNIISGYAAEIVKENSASNSIQSEVVDELNDSKEE